MYHVELRQFPGVARAFNLTAEQLEARILAPWAARDEIELDGRRFSPAKARVTILEGPELAAEQIGLGRGWGNATKASRDRTQELLAGARTPADRAAAAFKADLEARAGAGPTSLSELPALLAERHPQWRLSERQALAERAVWELLHEQRLVLISDGRALAAEEWPAALLDLSSWTPYATTSAIILARSASEANR